MGQDEERQGQYIYTFEYDDMGSRTFYRRSRNGNVQESMECTYNLHTDDDWKGNNGNGNSVANDNTSTGGTNDNNGNVNGNTNNTGGSQNQSGILLPIEGEVSELEQEMIDMIRTTGKHKNYELIEYVNDVNQEHAEVLMELNDNGIMETAYSYGNERLTRGRFTGWTGYYTIPTTRAAASAA